MFRLRNTLSDRTVYCNGNALGLFPGDTEFNYSQGPYHRDSSVSWFSKVPIENFQKPLHSNRFQFIFDKASCRPVQCIIWPDMLITSRSRA